MGIDRFGGVDEADRGVSQIVAIILLVAMVVLGAALVFTVGSSALGAFQSEAAGEKVHMCMDESDHRLSTVAMTGKEQSMAFDDPICQPQMDEKGAITITWFNSSDGEDPPWNDDSRTVTEDLGAFEFELDDRTVAHQGGGIWELTDSGAVIEKSPDIGFDSDDNLQLNFMRLESRNNGDSSLKAQSDYEGATDTTDRLAGITENPEGDDFAIKIESEYADGWEQHFERESEDVDGWNVSVDRPDENVVVVKVEGIGDVPESGHFLIDEDRGLTAHSNGKPHQIDDNLVGNGDSFHIDATLTNYGDAERKVTANLSIWNGSETVEERTIESKDKLEKDESIATSDHSRWNWIDGNGQHSFDPDSIDLTPGSEYKYDIETDPGGDTLDEQGSFYYLHDDAHYSVGDTGTSKSGNLINVSADIQNLGTDDGTSQTVTLEIMSEGGTETVVSDTPIQLNQTEAATVSWSINESNWPKGDYEFVVRTDDDEKDGTFTVENGGAFEISDDLGIPDKTQLNGTDGQVITETEEVTIRANVTNTYATERTQNVTLDVLDGEGNTVRSAETTLTIEGGNTEQVELTVDPVAAGEIYEYNISTETDDLDTLGSFLVVDEPAEFSIESATRVGNTVKPGEPLKVEVDIQNQGEDGGQFVWLQGFNGNIVDVQEIELDNGASTTARLEWGGVAVPSQVADTSVTVQTNSDKKTLDVDVDPLLVVNDVTVPDDPIDPGESVEVKAELESIAGDSNQRVILEGFDGSTVDSQMITVSDGETETVELEYRTEERSITDRISVRTDDDERDELVVLERDGPNCVTVGYEGSGTSDDPYEVSNIDELQCIDEHDLGADYELVNDLDAHGTEYWNDGDGFEPIGDQWSWGAEFSGNFDGNGNAIEGLHIDRPDEDFVGLFAANSHFHSGNQYGVGEGSNIHNLRLENVSVHGRQVTGGLIGAAGGVIENVRVSGTVEAEYQEVGGIIGSSHNADLDNRLVSEATVKGGIPAAATDEVSHPWGSNSMGIGGIVGATGYNTEISTAYSLADVEGPFAVGGIVGWTSDYASKNEQMYWAEGNITATADQHEIDNYLYRMNRYSYEDSTGGAIFGRGDDENDGFDDSVYYNTEHHDHPFGEHIIGDKISVNERTTDEMQGLEVTESDKLDSLHYKEEGGPWVAIPEDYPRFAWELAAEGAFEVSIDDVENVTTGEASTVEVTVTSRYEDRDESNVTQTIALEDPHGQTVDTETVTLSSELGESDTETIDLVWQTDAAENGTVEISVRSEDTEDSAPMTIESAEHGPGASTGPGLGPVPENGGINGNDELDAGPGESASSADDVIGSDSEITIGVDVIEID